MELICDRSGFFETAQASTLANPAQWLVDVLTGDCRSDTGIPITWKNAMSVSAAWYCVNTIAGDIAQLPLGIYSRSRDGATEEDRTHPAGKVLRNPMEGSLGAFHFRYLLQNHALINGNGRAFIVRNGRREPLAFVPLPADYTQTITIYDSETNIRTKWHVVWPEKGGEPIPLPDYDVFHIYRFSWDGYNGIAPLDLLKNSFGLSIAGDRFAARFYKQGGAPSYILEAPVGTFREQAKAEEFLRKFNEYHSGLDNANRVGLLREGVQAKVLGLDQQKAQMIEQRDFQVKDIMRVFGLHVIPGIDTSHAGYNGLEQLNRDYKLHAVGPWMKIWEQESARKLLTDREQRAESYFFMFDTWELVKPDAAAEAEMLTKYVGGMILESNEARDVIGYPPHEDGSGLRNPATTANTAATNDQGNASSQDREEALVAARLRPLVNAEIRRVREMAGKARNFVEWCETFYAKHQDRMAGVVQSLGGQEWIVSDYIEQSKYLLMQTAGSCQKEELAARIEQTTDGWTDRVIDLASNICEVAQ